MGKIIIILTASVSIFHIYIANICNCSIAFKFNKDVTDKKFDLLQTGQLQMKLSNGGQT